MTQIIHSTAIIAAKAKIGDDVKIGQPYIKNAKVVAEVVEEVKGEKVSILRFRRRKHSMRKIGHRQRYTQIKIKEINVGK